MNAFFFSNSKNKINEQSINSCSLICVLSDLINDFPQNFEISTNNGKYRFNKYLIKPLIPNIKKALQKNESLKEYHFDINDEQNVMQKIENLFKGESIEFLNSEESTIKQISSFFIIETFPLQFFSTEKLKENEKYVSHFLTSNEKIFPERMTIEMNPKAFLNILSQSPKEFKIKTNQNEYLCSSIGVSTSKTISKYLESHPTSTEYYFDFNEENKELKPIINFFNFKELKLTPSTANSILNIGEDLCITPLITSLNTYIHKMDEIFNLIDPYDHLFNNLFNIKKIGTEKVADFIEKSEWTKTKADIQELAACFLLVAKTNTSIITQLAELVQILSNSHKGFLSELLPFLTNYLLSVLGTYTNLCPFLYQLSRLNLVSIDSIIKMIPICSKNERLRYIYWFLPEIFDKKALPHDIILNILSNELGIEIKSDEKIEETISKIRFMRENCEQMNPLIKSITNDDIDTFQSIVSLNSIDVDKEKLKMTVFDSFGYQNEISFIDYSAFCGSIKCFKYLFLEKVSISYETLSYAVKGGNVEIIHILDQNKGNFVGTNNSILSAVEYHRNDIFDWLIENSNNLNSNDVKELFKSAISFGNGHVMLECFEKGLNLKNIYLPEVYDIIISICSNGFYKMLLFISNFILFSTFFNPIKYADEVSMEGDGNRSIIQEIYSNLMNASINMGNLKIIDFLFENMKVKYSVVINNLLIESAKLGKIEIIKHFLDDKTYELSDFNLVRIICSSIESGFDEMIDYFIVKNKEFPLTSEIISSACASENIKLVKSLIQMSTKKGILIDLTIPFLNAIRSKSEEIIKLFFELKVDINFNKVFDKFNDIIKDNPEAILLLINEVKPELKSILINESFKAALLTNNVEILKFLLTNKYEFEDLLIKAVEFSNLEIIKLILEFNNSVEFINKIGEFGTALFQAVKSMSNRKVESDAVYYSSEDDQKSQLEEMEKSKIQIIEYLLSQEGIDPSISIDSINTPLVEAVKTNNVSVVRLILDFYGDSIKNQGKQIHDSLRIILEKQSKRIKKQTEESNEEFNSYSNSDEIYITESNDVYKEQMIFSMLIGVRNLACINMMHEDVLYYAILENEPEIVKNLLNDKSIDVSKRVNKGDTYFHLSINGNFVTLIQRLLINHPSIDINSSNALKETPLVKAVKCKNKELVELILNHPKFNASLSLLNYAFMLSVKSKEIFMILIKVGSLDVNYLHMNMKNNKMEETFTTTLIEATKTNDLDIIKAIISHPFFDPIKSQIASCLFVAIQNKNLMLFKYFLGLNNNIDINLKNIKNESLLFSAAKTGFNSAILKEILGNEKFDPIKSDILSSFIISNDAESMNILVEYDEKHGMHHINLDKIYLISSKSDSDLFQVNLNYENIQNAIEFLLRKKGFLPMIPSICTSILSKNRPVYQRTYICKTCRMYQPICEICARVCHKGHIIILNEDNSQWNQTCCCRENCKCKSIVKSLHEDLYGILSLTEIKKTKPRLSVQEKRIFYEDEDEEKPDEFSFSMFNSYYDANEEEEKISSLKCTFDMAGFHSMSQPMYRCRKCKVDICQSCAILCHKDHPLNFKGFKFNVSCHCFEMTDCQCTSRKDVVCSYAFYGMEYVIQPRYKCVTCRNRNNEGICTACAKKCHHNHEFYYDSIIDHFCDCSNRCKCMALEFPPFNYMSSCTNREQKYELIKQRLYHCKTCGITAKNQGICEACALFCHQGHNVVYICICEFVCECFTINDCIAPKCPEISCDGVCSREKDTNGKVFPAFVCLSCDKDGEKKFCKSCALNCHKGHDVHFLEYSNFVCQCNQCKCNDK